MPTHDNGTVTLTLTKEEAAFLSRSIAATPLQGQLGSLLPAVMMGASLMTRLQEQLVEPRPTETPQGE